MRVPPSTSQTVHDAAFTSGDRLEIAPVDQALDLTRFDFTAGTARLWYAAWSSSRPGSAPGWWRAVPRAHPHPARTLDLPPAGLLGLRLLASFAGVYGFALTFDTPWRIALMTSAIGMLANTGRLLLIDAGGHPLICATAATMAVGLMAGWASKGSRHRASSCRFPPCSS